MRRCPNVFREEKAAEDDPQSYQRRGFFYRAQDMSERVLPMAVCHEAHDKRLFCEHAQASPAEFGLQQFMPETYLCHEQYLAAAREVPDDGGPVPAGSTGPCSDTWFFKEASADNGYGVVVLHGAQPAEEVTRLVVEKLKADKKRCPPGATDGGDGSGDGAAEEASQPATSSGVFQRFVPNLLLYDGRKFDLRVFATICPKTCEPFLFSEAAVRVAPEPFDRSSDSARVQMTHYTGMMPTKRWARWHEALPGIYIYIYIYIHIYIYIYIY